MLVIRFPCRNDDNTISRNLKRFGIPLINMLEQSAASLLRGSFLPVSVAEDFFASNNKPNIDRAFIMMYAGLSIYIRQIQRGLSVDFPALDGYGADGEEVKV